MVDLTHLPTADSRQPWLKCYFPSMKYNEKLHIRATLRNELSRKENWSEEKIKDLWIYRQEIQRLDTPYQSVETNDRFDKLWNGAHTDSDTSDDEDDDLKEVETNTEKGKEKELEA